MINPAKCRWWWLRHAPVPDPEGRISGRLDLACDTSDNEWFAVLANRLPRNAVLVESGLIRCAQTTGALEGAGLPLPPAQIEADLAEQDFGRWQGKTWGVLAAIQDPDLPAFWQNPATATPPGGESFATVVERVRAVVERLSSDFSGRDIVAVAHAGTIRAALAVALDIPPESALSFVVEPLSLTRIDAMDAGWRVVGVNWLPT
ncbi:histidine phosphatase family protein [Telmatospirillum sp.]|uniref:histidine phosphatase family protein n=1 Tax=Telmatospirillum sp. TaxID=2079197 RepID=UPI00283AF12D|nr:histidine phosphatase family protein [Telmatospirillum sp.]MDR3436999.1 histidine phosphatase family protein [Telmatospirillum sp.]